VFAPSDVRNRVEWSRMAIPRIAYLSCLALVLAAGIVCPCGVHVAYAGENGELSRARAKFQQAVELEEAGNYVTALTIYRDVGQVRMTPQVRFHIAVCEEKLGRFVAALGGYELALTGAEGVGPEFQKEAEDRANAVRVRIPKLIISRGRGAHAATIELDGVALGASSINVEVPLDPGPHTIQAKAPGYEQYVSTIDVRERNVEKITIALKAVSEDANSNSALTRSDPIDVASTSRIPRVVPYAIGSFGAAALLNAGVFFVLQRGKISDLQALCGTDRNCTDANPRPLVGDEVSRSHDLNSKLRLYTAVFQVSAVTGVVALGVAAGLVVLEPKPAKPTTSWAIQPVAPGAQLGGLSVVHAF